ncbi:RusA family crossover junction endodeoxyribonuclease [Schaalia sp. 19OD2882]|uniref:RusA family crossover junction endodeoxyribonuclease n=1 Tax=Schaalia sp. 19OD2882 TaxID=2794089 RepID=UPI001C1E9FBE|nr:RusA family crossover junction endodeoxyribonuclease [Schaalia sp. 19OD2882]QWW20148.1 RusA family crossover junction endodeoxyribonuclease [Schaalia sp. 19OD2882]
MTGREIEFFVAGTPVPEGSTKYLGHRGGRPIIVHDSPDLVAWRQAVALVAANEAAKAGWDLPLDEPVSVTTKFFMPRPKSAPGRALPAVKPDLDKLVRAVGDALGTRLLREDSRIVRWAADKVYVGQGGQPGVAIAVVRDVGGAEE